MKKKLNWKNGLLAFSLFMIFLFALPGILAMAETMDESDLQPLKVEVDEKAVLDEVKTYGKKSTGCRIHALGAHTGSLGCQGSLFQHIDATDPSKSTPNKNYKGIDDFYSSSTYGACGYFTVKIVDNINNETNTVYMNLGVKNGIWKGTQEVYQRVYTADSSKAAKFIKSKLPDDISASKKKTAADGYADDDGYCSDCRQYYWPFHILIRKTSVSGLTKDNISVKVKQGQFANVKDWTVSSETVTDTSGNKIACWDICGQVDTNALMVTNWGDASKGFDKRGILTLTLGASSATVTCKDVVGSTSGSVLGTSTEDAIVGTTYDAGTELGNSTAVGAYYANYAYTSGTSVTVKAGENTVYRIFNRPAYTITCVNRFYKNGVLQSNLTSTQGTMTKSHGESIAGSAWGTASPRAGYTYKSCTTINPVTANGTVYRDFALDGYKIVYHANGGEEADITDTAYLGENVTLRGADTFTKKETTNGDYQLAGWSTAEGEDNALSYECGASVGALSQTANAIVHLYAVWKPSLTVEVSGGTISIDGIQVDSGTKKYFSYGTSHNVAASPGTGKILNSVKINEKLYTAAEFFALMKESTEEGVVNALKDYLLKEPVKVIVVFETYNPVDVAKTVKNEDGIEIKDCIVNAGDVLTYEITVVNDTDLDRTFTVTDVLDTNLIYQENSASDGGSFADGTVKWGGLSISANGVKDISFKTVVSENAKGEVIENMATVVPNKIGAFDDESAPVPTAGVKNPVFDDAVKRMENENGEDISGTVLSSVSGNTYVYRISFENPAEDERTFEIVDVLPEGLTYVTSSDNGSHMGQVVTWSGISVAGKAKKEVLVTVTMDDDVADTDIVNNALIRSMDVNKAEIRTNDVVGYSFIPPVKSVYLALDETKENIDRQVVSDGALLTYQIDWMNPTDGERTVVLEDVIPEGTRIATDADLLLFKEGKDLSEIYDYLDGSTYMISDGGVYDEGMKTITWSLQSESTKTEKDKGSVSFSVVVLNLAEDKIVANEAYQTLVSPRGLNEDDPKVRSNRVTNPVLKTPDKVATRSTGQDVTDLVVNDGEKITYKIYVDNPAEEEKEFVVTDIVPEFTKLVEENGGYAISDGGVYDASENLITWEFALAAGEEKVVSFTVEVLETAQNSTVKNTARTYVDKAEKWTKDKITTDIFVLEDPSKAVLNVDGENIDGVVKKAGDTITYHIVFKNPADTEQMVTVTDALPEYAEFVSSKTQGSYDVETGEFVKTEGEASSTFDTASNTVTWKIPTAPGCQECAIVEVRIKEEAKGTVLKNSASVYIPDTTKNTNIVRTPVAENPEKTVKNAENVDVHGKLVTVGEEITYVIKVENPSEEDKVASVMDLLPKGVDFVSVSGNGVYDENLHSVTWPEISLSGKEETEVTVTVRVNESAASTTIKNEAVYHIDEAVVSTELRDGGKGGPEVYVATKYALNNKAEDINGKIVGVGDNITYKISYKNLEEDMRHFTIFDTLPEGTEIVEIGDGGKEVTQAIDGLEGEEVVKGRTVSWQFDVAPLEEGYVTVTVKVSAGTSGKLLKNDALFYIKGGESDFRMRTNEVVNPVIKTPVKMVFDKSGVEITDKMVAEDDVITYKVTFVNPTEETKSVKITDELPVEVSFISADNGGTYDKVSHLVTWDGLEVASKARLTVAVNVKVNENTGGKVIKNQATVYVDEAAVKTHAKTPSSTPEEPEPSEKETTDNYVAEKISMNKKGDNITGKILKVGDTFTYRIKYMNTSAKEKTYTITDTLPQEVDYVSSTGNPTVAGKILTWQNLTLKAGAEGYVDVTVKVNESGYGKKIENSATITDNGTEPGDTPYSVETKEAVNYIFGKEDFVKRVVDSNGKNMDEAVVESLVKLFYHIELTNPSENKETFVVTDVLPKGVKFVSATDGGTYNAEKRTVTWTLELAGKATASLEICVLVKEEAAGDALKNTGHVVTDSTEMDTNTVKTYVVELPKKSMSVKGKAVKDGETVAADSKLTYTIAYQNPTDETREIVITDVVDKRIAGTVSKISNGGKMSGNTITWTLDVKAGAKGKVSFEVTVPNLDGQEILNNATVTIKGNGLRGKTKLTTNTVRFRAAGTPVTVSTPGIVQTGDGGMLGWFITLFMSVLTAGGFHAVSVIKRIW